MWVRNAGSGERKKEKGRREGIEEKEEESEGT